MVRTSNRIYNEIYLRISENPTGFRIQTGKINSPENFLADQAILISGENPNLLWDILHTMMDIPYPILHPVVKPEEEVEPIEDSNIKTDPTDILEIINTQPKEKDQMEEELKKLSAKQIVEKVQREKNVSINISLKSKSAILKKALSILSAGSPSDNPA